jgi:hypothetical protein
MSKTLLAAFEIAFSVGLVGFWSFFFLVENKNPARSAVYLGFERSFPLPDLGWVTPCLVAADIHLELMTSCLRRSPSDALQKNQRAIIEVYSRKQRVVFTVSLDKSRVVYHNIVCFDTNWTNLPPGSMKRPVSL